MTTTINDLIQQYPNLVYSEYPKPIFRYYDSDNNLVFNIPNDHPNLIHQIQTAIAVYDNLKNKYDNFHFNHYLIEHNNEEHVITITVNKNATITIDLKIKQFYEGFSQNRNDINFQIEGYNDYLADFDPTQLIRTTYHTRATISNPNDTYNIIQKLTNQIQQNKLYKLLSEI